ncbi:hypothetical protein HMPREF0995_02425 [Lachnospiraceae bacterium 7_1_58FAA]|uniref:hypothetical protein n=1 Tax=Flavonifractor plautii TaxID=292800 RepID=UPI000246C19E|nr:hypothetical protein [Flavonifractor plautii]EHO33290.1 hypothetical protein HMPREF0995_02425 [Lachnospiraceae bacterium 7_1_58FAA]MDB7922811.1 hypothetical protein [Flavonifractor plautii]
MKLTKIELLESYATEQQLMRLTFDEGKDSAYIIWSHANLVQYLNDEVIATFRQDMYNGTISKFVNTIAKVGVVHTLERSNNVKLYVDVTDNHSNIRFKEIEDGGTAVNAIVYVTDIRFDSSARAEWADLTVMDQARKIAQLRIFSPDSKIQDFKGRYVMCDIRKNRYGLSTDSVVTVDNAFPFSPEVEISERFLMDAFAEDADILTLLAETKFADFAKKVVDLEPGYILVRLAIELDVASELANLVKEVDVDLIKRCLLIEKFNVFQQTSPYRNDIVTFVTASRYKFDHKNEVLLTLYSDEEKFSMERVVLKQVREMADTIINVKKGLIK